MKTFKKLTIGDKLYKVYTNYEGQEKPKWQEITVSNISVEDFEKVQHLLINKRSAYSGGYHYDFKFPIDLSDTNKIENGDVGYFTTEKEILHGILSEVGLKFIRKVESEIESKKDQIKNIRIAYWDYLN